MAKEEDFKTSDKVTNSLFKGAAFHKNDGDSTAEARKKIGSVPSVSARPTNKGNGGVDFDSLSDEEKRAFSLAIGDLKMAAGNPDKWAKSQAEIFKISPKSLKKAAAQLRKDLDEAGGVEEEVLRYPWWSAARDWNPNAIGAMGQKISNGFKFSPEMASVVSDSFRR